MRRHRGHEGALLSYILSAIHPHLVQPMAVNRAALTRWSQPRLLLEGWRRMPSPSRRSSMVSALWLLVLFIVHGLLRVLWLLWRRSAALRHLPVRIGIATSVLAISPAVVLLVVVAIIPLLIAALVIAIAIILLVLLAFIACLLSTRLRASLPMVLLLTRLRIAVVLLLLICHDVIGESRRPRARCSPNQRRVEGVVAERVGHQRRACRTA